MRGPAAVLALTLAAAPAAASDLAGVSLPDRTEAGGKTLVLNGMGVREATIMMIDVYVAGLYVEERSSDPAAILAPDRAKRLVLTFVRSVGREKLVDWFAEGLERNGGDKREAVAPGFAALSRAMTDVRKGESIVLTYLPGTGTTVTVRGKDALTIDGADFQSALFAIWLGPFPPNVGLREGLLGEDR